MRTPFIAGNWKMFKTVHEAVVYAKEFRSVVKDVTGVEIVVAPPFLAVHAVAEALRNSNVAVAAQNLYWEREGAFTGAVSAPMIKEAGAEFVIIGHSERRRLFGETDETVNRRLQAALAANVGPIVCVGETLEQRGEGRQKSVVSMQVERDLQGIPAEAMKDVAIAYEPIWAIGTGHTATPQQADEMHAAIRYSLGGLYGDQVAQGVCIMYGGSVKPGNVDDLLAQPEVDGALVGGASLGPESFARIVNFRS